MDKILIDTDVLLDIFLDREPFSNDSSKILDLCAKGRVMGFVTPVMISNVYYLLRKTNSQDKVIDNLKMLLTIVDISIIDKSTVSEALNSDFKDFEDALQNFSAQGSKEINIIITRNTKDYKTSKLSVMTPENYLKTIPK